MNYTEIFSAVKIENFIEKKEDIFNIFFLLKISIGCGYTLECPWQGGSNEYPQPMFWIKNKKNRHTPVNPSFLYKRGV